MSGAFPEWSGWSNTTWELFQLPKQQRPQVVWELGTLPWTKLMKEFSSSVCPKWEGPLLENHNACPGQHKVTRDCRPECPGVEQSQPHSWKMLAYEPVHLKTCWVGSETACAIEELISTKALIREHAVCLLDPFFYQFVLLRQWQPWKKWLPKCRYGRFNKCLGTLYWWVWFYKKEWQSAATNKHNNGQGQHRMKHKQYKAGLGQDVNGRDRMGGAGSTTDDREPSWVKPLQPERCDKE